MAYLNELQPLWLPLLLFTFLATATPGPNNMLLTLSGSQFGYRQTIPFIIGIRLGIALLFMIMGLGVGAVILANPNGYVLLKIIGASYLVYLAIKIAFSKQQFNCGKSAALLSLKQGMLLQFINPKSMMMVLSCVSAFSLPGQLYWLSVIQALIIFTLVGACNNSCWVLFGVGINRLLATPKAHQRFNRLLALLTLAAVALLFY